MDATTTNSEIVDRSPVWIFSRNVDLAAFLGSALMSLVLLAFGWSQGLLHTSDVPEWTWVSGVLLVDVAHVYATVFRVYLLPTELTRRTWLYLLVPGLSVLLGWAIASESESAFWRILAYIAVFHFVRQQVGWVAWYRRRGDDESSTSLLDYSAIYLATIYPLLYWHAHLPRNFWWFVDSDFLSLPVVMDQLVFPLYVTVFALYLLRIVRLYSRRRFRSLGKDCLVLTTAVCWYVGIVALNSDYAFTVTNVLIHGIPYMVLTFRYARSVGEPTWIRGSLLRAVLVFLATVWMLAYSEELLWNRGIWHEHLELFGPAMEIGLDRPLLLAILAMPQVTHYILDGFIWRRGQLSASFLRRT